MDNLVSIIIPVYNVEQYLDRCMESVVRQTYTDLEIILVDDGSKDNSSAICDKWGKKDNRILAIHQKNGGLSNARNTGINNASGKWIMFVDSDDVVSSNIVELLMQLAVSQGADIAIGGVMHIFDENSITFTEQVAPVFTYDAAHAIREMWYQHSFLPSAWGKIYKRSLFGNIRFTEKILFEDIDLMHELFWNSNKIVYSNIPLYGYVHRENSITTSKFSVRDCDILKISEKMITFSEKNDLSLQAAARSYAVTAAFRVYLNAPHDCAEYSTYLSKAEKILQEYGRDVLKDCSARRKTKCALLLYIYCKPVLRAVYKRKNRWK